MQLTGRQDLCPVQPSDPGPGQLHVQFLPEWQALHKHTEQAVLVIEIGEWQVYVHLQI